MSPPAAERGCAQDADGNLLSPSKIRFYNDPDDELPLPALPSSASSPPTASESSSLKPTTLARSYASANVLNNGLGARRSGRATRPSTRVTDPDNTESHAFFAPSGAKRKASTAGSAQQPRRLYKATDDEASGRDSQDDGNTNDDDITVDPSEIATEKASSDEEDVEANYASTKALGDADREVSYLVLLLAKLNTLSGQLTRRPKTERTADVRTIFVAVANHTNPDTGKVEKGNICTLCK
jgi:hypothetical protein